MADKTVLCAGCGITLRPFMRVCPRCGLERADAAPIQQVEPLESAAAAGAASASAAVKTNVVPFEAVRQQRAVGEEPHEIPSDMIFMSPNETKRRFPLFTSAQKLMIGIGTALLVMLLVVAYLLWRQHRQDTLRRAANALPAQPAATIPPNILPTPSPTPDGATGDAAIAEAVRLALSAYNPLGFSRYQFEVKEGVVTVNGEAEHQPEKDGVDNVVKLIAGVKSVVNNLKVKPSLPSTFGVASAPGVFNTAEAKVLDDALRRQAQLDEPAAAPTPDPAAREAERQRRELAAAKLREDELAMKRAAEEKLRRDADEQERKQDELRRAAEAERRARAEQAKLEASVLRSGTVAWSGLVDGVDEIILAGNSASVRHIDGQPAREVRASFSAPLPRSPVNVQMISSNGRGAIRIIQQPAATNGYTTIVRVDDSGKGGEKLHQFTLRWSAQ